MGKIIKKYLKDNGISKPFTYDFEKNVTSVNTIPCVTSFEQERRLKQTRYEVANSLHGEESLDVYKGIINQNQVKELKLKK